MANTQFKKGQTPWNKGTTGVMERNSGSFVKGQVPTNKIGATRDCSYCGVNFPVNLRRRVTI